MKLTARKGTRLRWGWLLPVCWLPFEWLRTCEHDLFGITRLRKQAEILIGHDNEHLAQIVEIREKLRMQNAK